MSSSVYKAAACAVLLTTVFGYTAARAEQQPTGPWVCEFESNSVNAVRRPAKPGDFSVANPRDCFAELLRRNSSGGDRQAAGPGPPGLPSVPQQPQTPPGPPEAKAGAGDCTSLEAALKALRGVGEKIQWIGLGGRGRKDLMLTRNSETGAWTILSLEPEGEACEVATGVSWAGFGAV